MTSLISAADIVDWNSLDDIASSLEKRGLKPRLNLGEENELVMQIADDEFVVLVSAGPGDNATNFKPQNRARHTHLVATSDFEEFTFISRHRSIQQHGRIKYQQFSFTKDQFRLDSGEKHTVLDKLNEIEYDDPFTVRDSLYDTRKVVKEFYNQFEELRTNLVQEVSGIPDDRGDAKQRFVQVLLDRMIFLYFIQEKRLLDRNPNYLHDKQQAVIEGDGDVYEEFYEPLFFDLLGEGTKDPDFGQLPYLNGGLFSKNPIEEKFDDARIGDSSLETNELFEEILSFLSDWNWNVDERLDIVDPKNLSPAILGHIFEQTVNQKEMGAYYTPEEITGFMARRTIHPYLLDQLNEAVDAEYEELDEVFGFETLDTSTDQEAVADGGTITQQAPTTNIQTEHVETLYHDILTETNVLDPAVGSGAFLLAAQEVLLDVYMQCIEFFEELEADGSGWKLQTRTLDELEQYHTTKGTPTLHAKRLIILNNLYGVDIDEGAVEICKLRLWLSMVADIEDEPSEVEPLPNIDFNIRQGNSLIGFTDLIEINSDGDAKLTNYGAGIGDSVQEKYEGVIEAVEKHRFAGSSVEATNWRKEAERRLSMYRSDLNRKVKNDFEDAGVQNITQDDIEDYSPFHWVLEFATVYKEGGFDVIIGNPPWDVIKADRDHFFSKHDEIFRTRQPNDKDAQQEALLDDPTIKQGWEEFQREMEIQSVYFNNTTEYNLQNPSIDGRPVGNENDLSLLFLERVTQLGQDKSYITQIMPGNFFLGGSAKDLREYLLDNTSLSHLVQFENHGIFPNIDERYRFAITTFKNSDETNIVHGVFGHGDLSAITDFESKAVTVPRTVLAGFSPESRLLPYFRSQSQIDLLSKIVKQPSIGEHIDETWFTEPYTELHRAQDSNRFVESEEDGDYPIYGGSNIFQFSYDNSHVWVDEPTLWSVDEDVDPSISAKRRIREKQFRGHDPLFSPKKAVYDAFDGTGSQKGFVDNLLESERGHPLSLDDVLLDCSEYRIAYREIANVGNERSMIATVLPKGIVCHHKLHTVRPYVINPTHDDLKNDNLHSAYERIFTDKELFVAVGLLNSLPFDYLLRSKIDNSIVMYKFRESQVPRLTDGDNWFHYISDRAARLNCYGDEFEEMRDRLGGIKPAETEEERQKIQAEIDAASMHAYGLNQEDVEFLLNDFHRVSNPRIMKDEYFEEVLQKFEVLEEKGPQP